MSGFGPYTGQAVWFKLLDGNKDPYGSARYLNEVHRMLKILEQQLTKPDSQGWLVLGKLTIADLSFLQWVRFLYKIGIDLEKEYPAIFKWKEAMLSIDAVKASTVGEVWSP